jgi:hypothetical protein
MTHLLTPTVVLTMLLSACAARGPVVDTGEKPAVASGTISGIVRGVGNSPLSGRRVTAIEVSSGAKLETSTGTNGGYTLKVAPGHYRLEVELRDGEALSDRPDDVHISASDLDAGRDFVITAKG